MTPPPARPLPLDGLRILLLDSEPAFRQRTCARLAEEGASVILAATVAEANQKAGWPLHLDALICSQELPDGTCLDLVQVVRLSIPVILLAADPARVVAPPSFVAAVLPHEAPPAHLVQTIAQVVHGQPPRGSRERR